MTMGVRSVSVAGADEAARAPMIHFDVNAEMKLASPGLPFKKAIAPSPPPSGLAMTGQLSVRILLSRAILMSCLANRSLPPPGPVSTMNWTLFGVPPAAPLDDVPHAALPNARATLAATTPMRLMVDFIVLPLGFRWLWLGQGRNRRGRRRHPNRERQERPGSHFPWWAGDYRVVG